MEGIKSSCLIVELGCQFLSLPWLVKEDCWQEKVCIVNGFQRILRTKRARSHSSATGESSTARAVRLAYCSGNTLRAPGWLEVGGFVSIHKLHACARGPPVRPAVSQPARPPARRTVCQLSDHGDGAPLGVFVSRGLLFKRAQSLFAVPSG